MHRALTTTFPAHAERKTVADPPSSGAGAATRVQALDVLRGVVMIVMALDHTRDYVHAAAMSFQPEDLRQTTAASSRRSIQSAWRMGDARREIERGGRAICSRVAGMRFAADGRHRPLQRRKPPVFRYRWRQASGCAQADPTVGQSLPVR
jgi:hypothetical protein